MLKWKYSKGKPTEKEFRKAGPKKELKRERGSNRMLARLRAESLKKALKKKGQR